MKNTRVKPGRAFLEEGAPLSLNHVLRTIPPLFFFERWASNTYATADPRRSCYHAGPFRKLFIHKTAKQSTPSMYGPLSDPLTIGYLVPKKTVHWLSVVGRFPITTGYQLHALQAKWRPCCPKCGGQKVRYAIASPNLRGLNAGCSQHVFHERLTPGSGGAYLGVICSCVCCALPGPLLATFIEICAVDVTVLVLALIIIQCNRSGVTR